MRRATPSTTPRPTSLAARQVNTVLVSQPLEEAVNRARGSNAREEVDVLAKENRALAVGESQSPGRGTIARDSEWMSSNSMRPPIPKYKSGIRAHNCSMRSARRMSIFR